MKIKLNGWLRLWLVVSLVWGISVISYQVYLFEDIKVKKTAILQFDNPNGGKPKIVKMVFSNTISEASIKSLAEKHGKEIREKGFDALPDVFEDPYNNYIKKQKEKLTTISLRIIAAPIILFLLFGLAVAWVRNGFKN